MLEEWVTLYELSGGPVNVDRFLHHQTGFEDAVPAGNSGRIPSGLKALREIRRCQQSVDLIIPRKTFGRIVREIASKSGEKRFRGTALEALQVMSESVLINLMEDANLIAINAKRVTIMERDMKLARLFRDL